MAVLLLRLAAPMQSWGINSKFDKRGTEKEPTKSGVIGMVAAALGLQRNATDTPEKLKILNKMKFGVRVEQEGKLLTDFQTVYMSGSTKGTSKDVISYRDYLCDAVFLCCFESCDIELLEKISNAIQNPVYPLFLGRRSCPPTLPIVLGIKEGNLLDILKSESDVDKNVKKHDGMRRIIYEVDSGGRVVQDNVISFSQRHREFGYRQVKEEIISKEHDPMAEL